jgi:hypothetical protein
MDAARRTAIPVRQTLLDPIAVEAQLVEQHQWPGSETGRRNSAKTAQETVPSLTCEFRASFTIDNQYGRPHY